MSQNFWATIMPFGPVTLIFYWPKKNISGRLTLMSGTDIPFMVYWSIAILTVDKDGYYNIHHRTHLWYTGLP